jgi:15-cis-phytoene synthase
LMLTASLIGPPPQDERHPPFVRGCRKLIEAMQRTDFLADLPEDLTQGRIGIPTDELKRHGLVLADLRERPQECAAAMENLVREQTVLTDAAFSTCRSLPESVDAQYQPFLRALLSVQELRLRAVKHNSGSILQSGASPKIPAALRILWREYRAVRSRRRQR